MANKLQKINYKNYNNLLYILLTLMNKKNHQMKKKMKLILNKYLKIII